MAAPRITALIDTYNQGGFVEEAIDSVLNQDFPAEKTEILVVDDGSTDDTRERVANYGDRVRYIGKPNGGQASALNLGFEQARGEIVAMLDGDDVWLPQKLRRIDEEFSRHWEAGMVYQPNLYVDEQRGVSFPEPNFTPVCGRVLDSLVNVLRFGAISTSSMSVRSAALREVLPIPRGLRILADTYLLGVLVCVAPVVAVNEALTRYRLHGANLCTFHDTDLQRSRQRAACSKLAAEEIKAWIGRRGMGPHQWPVAAHLARQELVAQMVGFMSSPPGRIEYFRYLREFQRLHAPLWSTRYRAFRMALDFAGLLLGYKRFERLRDIYRKRPKGLKLREAVVPVSSNLSLPRKIAAR
jgi:glycosyltransferase involved in cell wall biosynthesis